MADAYVIKQSDVNMVLLEGRVVRDAEYREYQDEAGWCEFTIASNLRVKKDTFHTSFIPCTVFGKRASKLAKRLIKGVAVVISGELKIRSYESNGVKRIAAEIMVDKIRPIGKFASEDEMLKGQALKDTLAREFEAQEVPFGDESDIPW